MALPGRLENLPPGSFARLATLLDSVAPGAEPLSLAVGDPKGEVPEFIAETIAKTAHQFGEYPPINGTAQWREAAAHWLKGRFNLPGEAVDPERCLLPLSGTREGLFLAPFIVTPDSKGGGRPVILLPNPFYQCYAAAVLGVGAEPVYVTASRDTGFLPDFAAVEPQVLARTAAVFVCSPSNPEGAAATEDHWRTLFGLADRYDFTVFADECYADIWFDHPPACALPVCYALSHGFDRLLTFHSLSKRSGLPGLRSGLVAGDPKLIAQFRYLRNYVGPQIPMPVMAASAAAWRDEEHVSANRKLYKEKMDLAYRILGNRAGFKIPDGGIFLWLDVGNGEQAALKLWREAGIRVLPGAYMGHEIIPGKPETNPGFRYIRVALVHPLSTIQAALERMAELLSGEAA